MNPDRWRRIEELYHSALEREPEQRAAFLVAACDGDAQLQSEIESLLSQNESPVDEPVWKVAEELLATGTNEVLPSGVRLGPYEILNLLGQGGMGAVYRARDTRLDRIVAIKLLRRELTGRADARKRFRQEAQAISSLNHPHVCLLHDIGEQDGIEYLVMEYVEGETLAHRISKGRLPADQALHYGKQIAEALAAAHARGIVHRDLKLANIMIAPGGIKVLDFGLAKFEHRAPTAPLLTTSRAIMGTPAYMAPEQLEGKTCDARTDIYALGLVLREMMSGHRSPKMPLEPAAMDRVVRTCLAVDPAERWQSAHDVRLALEWVKDAAGPTPVRQTHSTLTWALFAALAVCAIVVAIAHFREGTSAAPAFRFTINPPENSSFDSFAVSPDGRRLAFAATTNGRRALWLRSLETSSQQLFPGTEQAYNPFWSPDGRSLAFFSLGKLTILEMGTTGAAIRRTFDVGDTHPTASGAWGGKGVIVFNAQAFGPLRRVSANGGSPEILSHYTTRMQYTHSRPTFLPDGRFLFGALTDGEGSTIQAGSLDSPEMQRMLNGRAPVFLQFGGGHLMFQRGGTLIVQSFDSRSAALRAEPRVLAENVESYSASETGVLGYRTGETSLVRRLALLDRQGRILKTSQPHQGLNDISLSPNGKQLVAVIEAATGNDLWLIDPARETRSRFTSHRDSRNASPVWWPDGSLVAFSSNREGQGDLYIRASTGTGADRLLLPPAPGRGRFPTSVSRDGRFLVFHQHSAKVRHNFDLWVLPMKGDRKPIPLLETDFSERQGQLSPDGRWLAYTSDESGERQVYVGSFRLGAAGTSPMLEGKWPVSTNGGHSPKWSQDGKELFYIGDDERLYAVAVKPSENFESGVPKSLFELNRWVTSANFVYRYDVLPDGRFLIEDMIQELGQVPITVVTNWKALLEK